MNRKLSRITLLILVFIIVLGMMPIASASASTFRTTSCVNLREEPSTDARVVSVVNTGTNVEELEHNPDGWSRVRVGNSTGFIRSDFLRTATGGTSATFQTTAGVNIRASASTDASILDTVVAGTGVEVLEHDPAGWSRVRVGSTTGFIRSDFLTQGGSNAVQTAAAGSSASSDQVIATLRTVSVVNFRSGASTSSTAIRTLAQGTTVEVLENQSNGWSRVRHNGTTGFIRSDLINESGTRQTTTNLRTTTAVNFRSGASTNDSVIRLLAANTSVEVVEQRSDGWSSVRHNGTSGFISSEFLSATGASTSSNQAAIGSLRTVTGVNFRTGPSTNDSIIRLLAVNTAVEVLENQANGWSRVRHNGTVGFIRSDLLGTGPRTVELISWSEARHLVPLRRDMRVVDVRTGITFNLRAFSLSGHADVEPPTRADTDAILRSRNGVWAWAPRPVWVTIGDRTFAAALNGMPHDVSTISGNGMNGHLCLHFNNTVTRSQSYQRDLNNAVMEAYNARPR